MAYRDDLEALNAQVRTLKAELEAARQARTAAQAAAQAARAAADEAALIARRAGADAPAGADGGRRWMIITIAVGGLAAVVAGYLSYKLMDASTQTERVHSRMVQLEAATQGLRPRVEQLQRQLEHSERARNNLTNSLTLTRRSCRRERARYYGQRGAGDGQQASSAGGEIAIAPPTPPPPPSAQGTPETLSRAQIQAGMRQVKGLIQLCYERFKVPGLANVRVKIGPNGRVASSKTQGMFGGTPTGACVAAMARKAHFPRFTGDPITVTYPFILR